MKRELDAFFEPKSVAVVGASNKKGKIGATIFSNFLKNKKIKVYPINPNYEKVFGKKAYPSVLDLPAKVDLAVIAIPAFFVPRVVQECVEAIIPGVIIVSGGFSESGRDALERKLQDIIQWKKTRVLGPNCLGVFNPHSSINSVFVSMADFKFPEKGEVGIVSQSGSVGMALLTELQKRNIGVSKFASYGNALDVSESDLIEYLSEDKSTKLILVLLESIKNGEKFLKACRNSNKPIVIYKLGKNNRTRQALQSHTGALATDAKIYSGIFRQAGITEVGSWEQLFDLAMLHPSHIPKGRKFLIVSNSGGFGVICADEAYNNNLLLPAPSKNFLSRLNFPAHFSTMNPIDLTGDANPEHFLKVIEAAMDGKEYAGVIVIAVFKDKGEAVLVDKLISLKKKSRIPLYVVLPDAVSRHNCESVLRKNSIPVFDNPEILVKSLSLLVN